MINRTSRIAVNVPPECKDVYRSTAALMGVPVSKLIANLLQEALPQMRALQKSIIKSKKSNSPGTDMLRDLKGLTEKQTRDIDEIIKKK
jgi:hypothetical protein